MTSRPFAALAAAAALILVLTVHAAPGVAASRPDAPAAAAAGSIPDPALVEVPLGGSVTAETLLRAGFDLVEARADAVRLLAWPGDDVRLAALGATVRVVDATPGRTAARLAEAEIAAGTRVPQPLRSGTTTLAAPPYGGGAMGGYWTTAEIKQKLDELVANDTHDCVAAKLDTAGWSLEGRPIWTLTLGRTVAGPDTRPVVYFNSLTHAREPGGMQALFWFLDDLLANDGVDPFATWLLDTRRIVVCPLVNPDGYRQNELTYSANHSFGMWRKNTRDNNGNGTFSPDSDGVDLNRNFSVQWGYDNIGSSPDVTTETYRGPYAFSEPESQVQRDLVAAIQPKTGLSFHTYQDILLHAWGYTSSAPLDAAAFHEWNDLLARDTQFQTGQSGGLLYPVNGDFNDWCYGDTLTKPRAFTWTPEIGSQSDGFWPPPSRIVPLSATTLRTCYLVTAIAGAYVHVEGWSVAEGALNAHFSGHVTVRARNAGAGASAGPGLYAVMTPLDPGVRMLANTVAYPTLAPRTSGNPLAPFQLAIDDTVTPGRLVRFQVRFGDDHGLVSVDTLAIPLGTPTVLASDDGTTGMSKWTVSSGWGLTSSAAHPAPYFTDSPAGNYAIGSAATMTLTASLNLSPGVHAYTVYGAKWDIERDNDAGVVEASTNGGGSWTGVRSTGMRPGTGFGVQSPAGKWFHTGTRWNWRADWGDLSPFTGAAGGAVKLRFRLRSDGLSNYDGLSLDSIRVLLYDPAAQPSLLAVGPASASGRVELSAAAPNPASRATRFEFALPVAGAVSLEVLDVQGRHVRTLASGTAAAGSYARRWDLADDAGHRAGPGVYFVRLATPAGRLTRRVVVVD